MIYKFRCKAAGDLIMLGPNGDQLLQLIGREPAPKGIVEVADMPAAIAALREAVLHEPPPPEDDEDAQKKVSLRQRVWPMVQMLEQAHAAGEPIVWGV